MKETRVGLAEFMTLQGILKEYCRNELKKFRKTRVVSVAFRLRTRNSK